MKDLIKQLLREGLNEKQLEEGKLKSAIAGGLMGLGALAGGNAQAQDIPHKPQTSMFGTPEQRAEKMAIRNANKKKIEDDFINGAVNAGLYEPVGDVEYNKGLIQVMDTPFYDRKVSFAQMDDGTKIKVFIKKFSQLIEKRRNQPDADRTYGAGHCKTGANGERISEPGDTETNRKHCQGSQKGMEDRKSIETGERKT